MFCLKRIFTLLFFTSVAAFAQTSEISVGSSTAGQRTQQGGYFDYSEPESMNIKVSVWGYVKYPGKYLIPAGSTVNDLLSYAGGPADDGEINRLRLFKSEGDSAELVNVAYKDFIHGDEYKKTVSLSPKLEAGNILIVPGEPRMHFRDYLSMTLSVTSALISLAILLFK
jgi:hypothetical protein